MAFLVTVTAENATLSELLCSMELLFLRDARHISIIRLITVIGFETVVDYDYSLILIFKTLKILGMKNVTLRPYNPYEGSTKNIMSLWTLCL
jgi:hypothetical protein